MKDMLEQIVAVGTDVHVAEIRNGSILVENMTMAGHA
jgi:predicted Zn-dependent protease